MALDDFEEAEEVGEKPFCPIGVNVITCVIADTDDHDEALRVAEEISEKIEEIDHDGVEVTADATTDYFYPEN